MRHERARRGGIPKNGSRLRIAGGALLIGLMVASCNPTPRPMSSWPLDPIDYPQSVLDTKARLIACSEAQGPGPNVITGVRWESVTVRFVVTEDGDVDPLSPYAIRSNAFRSRAPASAGAIEEAKQRALTCRYEPGRLEDQAVRAVVERTFRIQVGA